MTQLTETVVTTTENVAGAVVETTTDTVTATADVAKEVTMEVADTTVELGKDLANKGTDLASNVYQSAVAPISNIQNSIQPALDAFMEAAPKILMGVLILIIGLILAGILERLARKVLKMIKLDETSEKIGLKETLRKSGINISFANFIAKFVKYAVIILTLIASADLAGLTSLSGTLEDLLAFIPKILIALVILAGGLVGGEFSKKFAVNATKATEMSDKEGYLIGSFLKSAILVIAGFMALSQILGAENTQILDIIVAGFALAAALAFGLGSKNAVEKFWEKLSDKSSN